MTARMSGLRRALIVSGALFATVFVLLAAQLWLGNDPALGDGSARADARQDDGGARASVWDTVLGAAAGALQDDEGEDEGSSSPAVSSRTS